MPHIVVVNLLCQKNCFLGARDELKEEDEEEEESGGQGHEMNQSSNGEKELNSFSAYKRETHQCQTNKLSCLDELS